MSGKIYTAAVNGLIASLVEVECDIGRSLPAFQIVGLPDSAVKEARERVRAAIRNSHCSFPVTKVTVNLAPGDVPKIGPAFDLSVAIAILLSDQEIKAPLQFLSETIFWGELGLDGSLRPVSGCLSAALLARRLGFRNIIVPVANAGEAALVDGLKVFSAANLTAVLKHIISEEELPVQASTTIAAVQESQFLDFAHIKGQVVAKRALEIAAAGNHNVRLSGPPGVGKTMLARALLGILPPLARAEVLETTSIHSAAGLLGGKPYMAQRPFRSPHHTTSYVALVGGGTYPRPGEVSLAHRGVLFLDELPEFPRRSLEALRQPLEDGVVSVARAAGQVTFPARFTLVTAENPCPCGWRYESIRQCTCSAVELQRYDRRLSGPLIDRIDMHITVPALELNDLVAQNIVEDSLAIRERVSAARQRQLNRFHGTTTLTNDEMSSAQVQKLVRSTSGAKKILYESVTKLKLSARGYTRLLKIGQTIADLAGAPEVQAEHMAEALQYRPPQRLS